MTEDNNEILRQSLMCSLENMMKMPAPETVKVTASGDVVHPEMVDAVKPREDN